MKLKEKFENFKTMPVGFHVETMEGAMLLGEILEIIEAMDGHESSIMHTMRVYLTKHDDTKMMYVTKNHPKDAGGIFRVGKVNKSGKLLNIIYKVTEDELQEYFDNIQQQSEKYDRICYNCKFHNNFTGVCEINQGHYGDNVTGNASCCVDFKHKI